MRNPAGGGGGEAGGDAEGAAQASGSAARALPAQPEQERQQARLVSGAPADLKGQAQEGVENGPG